MPPLNSFQKSVVAMAISQGVSLNSQAAVITVNNTDDVLDSSVSTCTFREAVTTVNAVNRLNPSAVDLANGCGTADGNNDTINLPAGVFTLNTNTQVPFPGIYSNLILNGSGVQNTTIDGNSNRIIYVGGEVDGVGSPPPVEVKINDIKLTGGLNRRGGAINIDQHANVQINNSSITANSATFAGGGIYAYSANSRLEINSSTISNNTASSNGGGIYLSELGDIRINNSTISSNMGRSAGGISMYDSGASTSTINNTTIATNTSQVSPGGLYLSYSNVKLINSIVAGNTASNNRANEIGLYESDLSLAKNNILGTNVAISTDNFERTDSNGTPNLPSTIDGSNLDGSSDAQNILLTAIIETLANNVGATQTHNLVENSPAVDFGDNASCLATDQRGEARANDSSDNCDAGAVEFVRQVPDETFFVVPTKNGKVVIFNL